MSVDLIFANCRRQAGKEYAPLLAPGPAVCWSLSVIALRRFVATLRNFIEFIGESYVMLKRSGGLLR